MDLTPITMDPDDYTDGYVKPGWIEGTIDNAYLSWQGHDMVLDGSFSAADLRSLADHMDKFS